LEDIVVVRNGSTEVMGNGKESMEINGGK